MFNIAEAEGHLVKMQTERDTLMNKEHPTIADWERYKTLKTECDSLFQLIQYKKRNR